MFNKWRYKKPIIMKRTNYNLVDEIKLNNKIRLIERNNKNIDLIVHITPKTYIIEEV